MLDPEGAEFSIRLNGFWTSVRCASAGTANPRIIKNNAVNRVCALRQVGIRYHLIDCNGWRWNMPTRQ